MKNSFPSAAVFPAEAEDGSDFTAAQWRQLGETLEPDQAVLVAILDTKGSSPRKRGALMLVSETKVSVSASVCAPGVVPGDSSEPGRTSGWTIGSIGGGNLEYQAIQQAQAMLRAPESERYTTRTLQLGVDSGQCCGGLVTLMWERLSSAGLAAMRTLGADGALFVPLEHPEKKLRLVLQRPELMIFGAGHVGQAVVRLAQILEIPTELVDTREAFLDAFRPGPGSERGASQFRPRPQAAAEPDGGGGVPPGGSPGQSFVEALGLSFAQSFGQSLGQEIGQSIGQWIGGESRDPLSGGLPSPRLTANLDEALGHLTSRHAVFVMTHSHALDYDVVKAILARSRPVDFLGLIGSKTKGARFRQRLERELGGSVDLSPLVCPVGPAASGSRGGSRGRPLYRPAEIALSFLAAWQSSRQAENPGQEVRADDELVAAVASSA